MLNKIFIYIYLVLAVSCGKDSSDEYATDNTKNGIVGRWKLIETSTSDGGSDMTIIDMTSENYIVSFDSIGNIKLPEFPCDGKYSFSAENFDENYVPNLKISVKGCDRTTVVSYTILGNSFAKIIDSNYLSVNDEGCDEPCAKKFRRLK